MEISKELLSEVIDNVQAFVLLIDRNFNVLYTNYYQLTGEPETGEIRKLGELLHCSVYEAGGKRCGQYESCEQCPVKMALEDAFMRRADIAQLETGLNIRTIDDPKVKPVDTYLTAKYLRLGTQDCMVVTLYDVSMIKSFADELKLANDRAERGEQAKSAFLASMSHEIRTPLNAIVGFSQLLTNTKDKDKQAQYVNQIENNNDILLQLINDILDMAKIETGTIECYPKPTELSSLILKAEESVKMKLQPGVMLNYVLGANKHVINTDPQRLMQVLLNLLTNACKFTNKGAITFGYELYDDEVYFFCKDTGIGMDDELKDKLFNLFTQGDNFTQGTGLGLAISKAVEEKLGGKIGAESRGKGKGSTFWFTLPNDVAELSAEDEAALETAQEAPEEAPAEEKHQVTIMVAEDNESNYLLFRSILEQHYNLVRAHEGVEAVEQFKKTNPDLILMDINMPNMDGYEAVAEIRKLNTKVPIIAVTAYAFVSDRQRILSNGFNGYVSKPINVTRLEREINNCLPGL